MPHKFKTIFNGNNLVLRKTTQKGCGANAKSAVTSAVAVADIPKAAPTTKSVDAKALRAQLSAELFKSL